MKQKQLIKFDEFDRFLLGLLRDGTITDTCSMQIIECLKSVKSTRSILSEMLKEGD